MKERTTVVYNFNIQIFTQYRCEIVIRNKFCFSDKNILLEGKIF